MKPVILGVLEGGGVVVLIRTGDDVVVSIRTGDDKVGAGVVSATVVSGSGVSDGVVISVTDGVVVSATGEVLPPQTQTPHVSDEASEAAVVDTDIVVGAGVVEGLVSRCGMMLLMVVVEGIGVVVLGRRYGTVPVEGVVEVADVSLYGRKPVVEAVVVFISL